MEVEGKGWIKMRGGGGQKEGNQRIKIRERKGKNRAIGEKIEEWEKENGKMEGQK